MRKYSQIFKKLLTKENVIYFPKDSLFLLSRNMYQGIPPENEGREQNSVDKVFATEA